MRFTLLLLPLALLFAGCDSKQTQPDYGSTNGGEQATTGNGGYVPYPDKASEQ